MDDFSYMITIIGGFIVILALLSLLIKERLYISDILLATIAGIIMGRSGFDILKIKNKTDSGKILFEFSRMVIGIQVIAVGMVVPRKFVSKAKISILVMLGPLMLFSWLIASALVHYILSISWQMSLIVGACITPTDPVLASSILKGKFANKYIPLHIRKLLCFESGVNDGLCLPLLRLPMLFLLNKKETKMHILKLWMIETWIKEIFGSLILGILIGLIARYLLNQSRKYNLIDKESFLAYTFALCLFVIGIGGILKVDDIFGCFVCGVVFSWYDEDTIKEVKESHLFEIIDMLLSLSFFIYFGMNVSFDIKVKNVLLCVAVLFLRRLPLFFVSSKIIKELHNIREVFFAGWFGPIGVGAIYLSLFSSHQLNNNVDLSDLKQMENIINLIVMSSVIVHGITAPVIHFHLRKTINQDLDLNCDHSEYTETESLENVDFEPYNIKVVR